MAVKKQHPHILLAENQAGMASYCDTCHVIELEIGAFSLRVDETSLALLSELLRDANYCLNVYQKERQKFTQDTPADLMFH